MGHKFDIPHLPQFAKETVQEQVYQRLCHALLIGSLKPGATITLRGVAAALDVSLTPVRAALKRLEAEKAIKLKDNRRIVIPSMDLAKFESLINIRILLETNSAERSLKYIDNKQIDHLLAIDQSIDEAVENEDWEQAVIRNQAFHRKIILADPYQVSMPMINSVWLQLGPFLRLAVAGVPKFYPIDRHAEIIDAIREQDTEKLHEAIKNDILDGVDHLRIDELLQTLTHQSN